MSSDTAEIEGEKVKEKERGVFAAGLPRQSHVHPAALYSLHLTKMKLITSAAETRCCRPDENAHPDAPVLHIPPTPHRARTRNHATSSDGPANIPVMTRRGPR